MGVRSDAARKAWVTRRKNAWDSAQRSTRGSYLIKLEREDFLYLFELSKENPRADVGDAVKALIDYHRGAGSIMEGVATR